MTTAQLQLDVGVRQAAGIERVLLVELDHFHAEPPDPGDAQNVESHAALIRGHELLLDWLAAAPDPLPQDPVAWPCSACKAAIGDSCDIPEPGSRTKSTPPGPRYHLDRGLHGRWGSLLVCP